MEKDPLDELLQFLKPESRVDLKHISLQHLVGVSGTDEGVNVLIKKDEIVARVVDLSDDKVDDVAKNALLMLVNVSANARGAIAMLNCRPPIAANVIELFIGHILNCNKKNADAACMILSNMTRVESILEKCVDTFLPHLNSILNAFLNTEFNRTGSNLNYISPMFSNLSCSPRIRKWLTDEKPYVPLLKFLPFCNYESSNIRRGGVIGTIRNLSFDKEYHSFLLSPDLDLLTYLLSPLMGNEEYPDDEMDSLPIALQYLPKEKCRDSDIDIRKMIIETLNKLCSKRLGREALRDNGVYYILREYHKWEKDAAVLLACENVVDILIQKEDEVGAEDLTSIEVPDDMVDKFKQMDEDYINSVK